MAERVPTEEVNYGEDLDNIDFNNYKGMFFQDDPGQKYQDEETGAHFEYRDMCRRLDRLRHERADPDPAPVPAVADSHHFSICATFDNAEKDRGKTGSKVRESGTHQKGYSINFGQRQTGKGRNKENGKLPQHQSCMRLAGDDEPASRSKSSDKRKSNGPTKEPAARAPCIERQNTYDCGCESKGQNKKWAFADLYSCMPEKSVDNEISSLYWRPASGSDSLRLMRKLCCSPSTISPKLLEIDGSRPPPWGSTSLWGQRPNPSSRRIRAETW